MGCGVSGGVGCVMGGGGTGWRGWGGGTHEEHWENDWQTYSVPCSRPK